MKRHFTFLAAALLFAQASIACFAPRSGAEYDQLIHIESTDTKNHYRVTVPKTLEDLQKAQIILAYSESLSGGITIDEPYEVLKTKSRGQTSSAVFSVEDRGERRPFIAVMWWPESCCSCGIRANSGLLAVE